MAILIDFNLSAVSALVHMARGDLEGRTKMKAAITISARMVTAVIQMRGIATTMAREDGE